MTPELRVRLNGVLLRLRSDELLNNKGLGNEIGFYIFDYPPEEELSVRDFLANTVEPALTKHTPPISYVHVNLFQLVLDYLQERGYLQKAIDLQLKQGNEALLKSLRAPLREERIAEQFMKRIDSTRDRVVLVSGVGSVYPLLRTHTLLSALHPLMGPIPLVMFYPGQFDGTQLKLFNRLQSDNYYRAFRLVP